MKDCEFVANPVQPPTEDEDEDDDDDFDEDDMKKPKTLKISPVSQLLCSMKETVNSKVNGEFNDKLKQLIRENVAEYMSDAVKNDWFYFMEIDYNFQLLCSGIELRQPIARFENGRKILSVGLNKKPLRIDEYCDNMWQEGVMLSPYMINR